MKGRFAGCCTGAWPMSHRSALSSAMPSSRERWAAGTAAVAAAIPLAAAGLRLMPVAPHATGPRVPAAYVLTGQGLEPIGSATKVSGNPHSVSVSDQFAITPDGKTTYVADYGSSTVTPITPAIGTPRPPIPVSPTRTPSPRSQPPQATPERQAPGTRRPQARCRPRPGELAARSGGRPHRGGGEPGHGPDQHPCPARRRADPRPASRSRR